MLDGFASDAKDTVRAGLFGSRSFYCIAMSYTESKDSSHYQLIKHNITHLSFGL